MRLDEHKKRGRRGKERKGRREEGDDKEGKIGIKEAQESKRKRWETPRRMKKNGIRYKGGEGRKTTLRESR